MGPLDPSRLGAFLMRQMPPADSEVIERGNVLPLGTYRTPDGRETTTLAFPQPMREGLDALAYALGYRQDPNAPAGYVTHDALNKGGQGLAESAMVGSLGARAPAGALRSGMAKPDLDPSLAARMARAREMGFDTEMPLYHGTAADNLSEFDVSRSGTVQPSDWGEGVYFTPSKSVAEHYRSEAIKRGGLDAEYNRALEKYESLPDGSQEKREALKEFQEIGRRRTLASLAGNTEGGSVVESYVRMANPYIKSYSNMPDPDLARRAKALGHDGIKILNANGEVDEVLVFDPSNIRSVNAMFDPSKSDSANLLAANPMAGAVPLAFPAPQEDRNQALARFLASGGA